MIFLNHIWVLGVPESEKFSAEKVFIDHLIQHPYFIDWEHQDKIIPVSLWICPPGLGQFLDGINPGVISENLVVEGRTASPQRVFSQNKSGHDLRILGRRKKK